MKRELGNFRGLAKFHRNEDQIRQEANEADHAAYVGFKLNINCTASLFCQSN